MPSTVPDKAGERIQVAAGVIFDSQRRVLISLRASHQHQGGLWEFPGGKLEPDESQFEALQREIREELGLEILNAEPFQKIDFDYPDKSVALYFWTVDSFQGEVVAREGQPFCWVPIENLSQYDFPEANQPIVELLCNRFGSL